MLAGDFGLLTSGQPEGELAAVALDAGGNPVGPYFAADAPPNGSVVELPVLASSLGLGTGHGTFTYTVSTVDGQTGLTDVVPGEASFDPYSAGHLQRRLPAAGERRHPALDLVVDTRADPGRARPGLAAGDAGRCRWRGRRR